MDKEKNELAPILKAKMEECAWMSKCIQQLLKENAELRHDIARAMANHVADLNG
jgi:hypothetical protein